MNLNDLNLLFLQFLQQYRHYQSNVEIFKHQPDKTNKDLAELVMFLAQVWRSFLLKSIYMYALDVLWLNSCCVTGYMWFLSSGWTLLLRGAVRFPSAADWSALKPSYGAGAGSQNGANNICCLADIFILNYIQ